MTLYKIALSDRSIDTDLKVPKRIKKINIDINEEKYKLGCATIHKKNYLGEDEFEIYKTKTERLDNLLLKKKIGFIKIDVEGHEKNVILGSKEVIKKNKPNLLVEIEERHSKEKVEETINFINGLGYKSYYVEKEILKSTKKLVNYSYKNNFIFLS